MRLEHCIKTLGERSYEEVLVQVRHMRQQKYVVRASSKKRKERAAKRETSSMAKKVQKLASQISLEELRAIMGDTE